MTAPASFRRIVERSWDENRLFSVLLELTYRCNLDCFFCYNDTQLEGRPLALDQYLALFDDLRDLHVLNLTLSGGEPLAHPDFFRLGREARERGFMLRIKSNGHALDETRARRLRDEVDPFIVEVSLHGATAATHDRQTRVRGSFERLVRNLGGMRATGLRVKINSTLTAWNAAEVEGMLDLAASFEVPLQFDTEVTPRDDGDREPQTIAPSRAQIEHLFAVQEERSRRAATGSPPAAAIGRQADADLGPAPPRKHCGAGSNGLAIDPYGNVYPCVQWRRSVGSLHERSLREIWLGSKGLDEIRDLTEGVAERLRSEFGADAALLSFCPGLAAVSSGDPLEVYDGARLRHDIGVEALGRKKPGGARLPVLA